MPTTPKKMNSKGKGKGTAAKSKAARYSEPKNKDEAKKVIRLHVREVKRLAKLHGYMVTCALGKSGSEARPLNDWARYIKWFSGSDFYNRENKDTLMKQAKDEKATGDAWQAFLKGEGYNDEYDYDDADNDLYDGYDESYGESD